MDIPLYYEVDVLHYFGYFYAEEKFVLLINYGEGAVNY